MNSRRGGFRKRPRAWQQEVNSDQFFLLQGVNNGSIKKKTKKFPHHVKYPFSALPDTAESFTVNISPTNLTCFHGFGSVFTLQHRIDNFTYKSVDQYYQIRKIKDLLGMECEKFTDGSNTNYSALARELLKSGSISRNTVDKWRVTAGVEVIQKGLLEKLRQCKELKEELIQTGDRLLAHTYAGDDFFGTGVPAKYVNDWCKGMEEKKVVVKFPLAFPLNEDNLKHVPTIGKGRNILGVIYMIMREKLKSNQLEEINVPLSYYGTIATTYTTQTASNSTLFNTANTTFDEKRNGNMEYDFTSDR